MNSKRFYGDFSHIQIQAENFIRPYPSKTIYVSKIQKVVSKLRENFALFKNFKNPVSLKLNRT